MSERGKLALYRKYRPKKLDEIIGQPQVTDILKAAVEKQIIGHAYLFSGPRGTGKTSAARILAHEFNQIPYADDSLNLDIIEIDAASNRRIEDIRDLREVVKLAPTKAKYKIYIIDEVHMLTTESFNALLKTLEEPPEHAIFILATTDLHKVPPTILSRTQKFTFKLLSVDELAQHLASICKKEGIKAGKDALSLIAELGGGSVRDAISILDQLQSLGEEITENLVRDVMGMPSAKLQTEVQKALENYDSAKLLSLTSQMMEIGANQKEIIKNLISSLVKIPKTTNLHLKLIDDLADALNAYDPLLFLNIALLKFNPNIEQVELGKPKLDSRKAFQSSGSARPVKTSFSSLNEATASPQEDKTTFSSPEANPEELEFLRKSSQIVTPKVSAQQPVSVEKDSAVAEKVPQPQTETNDDKPEKIDEAVASDLPSDEAELKPTKPATSNLKFSGVTWQKVLQEVKSKSASTYAMMRLSQAEVDGDNLNVVFKFEFHKKKMDEGKNRQALIDALKRVINSEPQLKYFVDKDVKLGSTSLGAEGETQDISPDQSSILGKISNIMGGGEVVNEDE